MQALFRFIVISTAILLGSCVKAIASSEPAPITIPIRFNIITDLDMPKKGEAMSSWVTRRDIENTIMPEINRIWRPANIQFSAANITETKALNPDNKAELISCIVTAKRDDEGHSDPRRVKCLNDLIDWREHDDSAINIYLAPYLGETSQGNARRRANRIFLTQYTDKPFRAKRPPVRFKLFERLPFKQGSLSRTLAHEIGHILSLKHPNKSTQTQFDLLMGGKKQGYTLTEEHIQKARSAGLDLVQAH